jgi:hypothetical protein
MNWGTRIAIVYSGFVIMIILLAWKTTSQKSDLVATDYYEKEVKYQGTIDGIKNTAMLPVGFSTETTHNTIVFHYPSSFSGKKVKGEFLLYRPSDSEKDQKFIASDTGGVQSLVLKNPLKGLYKLECDLEVDGAKYYFEEPIQIN